MKEKKRNSRIIETNTITYRRYKTENKETVDTVFNKSSSGRVSSDKNNLYYKTETSLNLRNCVDIKKSSNNTSTQSNILKYDVILSTYLKFCTVLSIFLLYGMMNNYCLSLSSDPVPHNEVTSVCNVDVGGREGVGEGVGKGRSETMFVRGDVSGVGPCSPPLHCNNLNNTQNEVDVGGKPSKEKGRSNTVCEGYVSGDGLCSPTLHCKIVNNTQNEVYINSQDDGKSDNDETSQDASQVLKSLKMKYSDNVVVAQLNINSIRNKFDQLLSIIQGNVEILVITETKLDSTFPISQFMIDGYSTPFRLDRNSNGGGILVFVREDIPSKKLQGYTLPDDIEVVPIEINLRKTKFLLLATYHPPSQSDEYFFDNITKTLDKYAHSYEKVLLAGDFNAQDNEPGINNFISEHNLKNIVKDPTCFKSSENPTCIDLFITNFPNSFQSTKTLSTGLSDFHKMVLTVLKNKFVKLKPKEIKYRCYRTINREIFRFELNSSLSGVSSLEEFDDTYLRILNKHAPIKTKTVRINQAPYMTKTLRKAIMRRSALKNKFYKDKTPTAERMYKKQKNFCSRLYKKERRKFYNNLDIKKFTDNKMFWKTVKPFLSDKGNSSKKINLVEGDTIVSEDSEVAEILNTYFSKSVNSLEIQENSYILNSADHLQDPIDKALHKFNAHPSILKIRERVKGGTFRFSNMTQKEVVSEINSLNPNKANISNSITNYKFEREYRCNWRCFT